MKTLLVVLALWLLSGQGTSQAVDSGTVRECFEKKCPEGTFVCKKHSYTSKDKKYIEYDISCLDEKRKVLETFHGQDENTLIPGAFFESYSYSANFTPERGSFHFKRNNFVYAAGLS